MTTIAELVDTEPDPAFGTPAGFPALAGGGTWRAVLELADPSAGSSVEWFDITDYFTGYEYTRGSDSFLGRYRAGIVTLDLYADDDRLAPWNDDTSATFGVNVQLGAGILLRFGFIRVDAGVVEEWNPRWTCRVQLWADAAYSQGKIRRHRIIARDTLTALVNVPIPADTEENWTNRVTSILTEAGWEYGSTIYGPTTIGGVGIFPLPDRAAQTSAINELDASVDPAGAVWYTNRKGQLIVRPSVYDTWLASKFDPGGAAGTPYPTADPTVFAWWACTGEEPPGDYGDLDTADVAAYAMDTPGVDPFGLDRSELAVINHVVITSPSGTYDDDNPTSVQRYDRHTLQASWIAANDFVADDILAARANATLEARPLTTTILLDGFQLGPSTVDYLDPVDVWHRNGTGLEAHAEGWCRGYRERVRPLGCDTDWSITLTLDVFDSESRDVSLLPVTDLTLTDVTDMTASFTWGNPSQPVTPTHTQVRMNNGIWLDLPYPITGMTWGSLSPYTPYEFEVRLIRVVDGIVTHFSPSRSVVFMTADPDVPVIEPDPDDPTGVIVTPPAPDDPEDCILEWELQESADGETGWTTIDDGTETVPPYTFAIDLTGLDDEMWYRVQTREVCGGVPGDWVISAIFPPICFPVSQLGVPPFDDADLVAYWPQVCPGSIAEAVSDEPMTFGPAWAGGPGLDGAGIPVMQSAAEGVIGYGVSPTVVPGDSDLTIACRVNFSTLPNDPVIVFGYGGLYFTVETSGSDWIVEGHCLELGVGTITITSFTTQDLNTEYVLMLTHTVDDNLRLYVDDVLVDTSGSTIGERATPLGDLYQIGAPANSWITDCAVWDTILAAPFLPSDLANLTGWWDASDAGTITSAGGAVSQWNDKSASLRHAVQATGANQPTTGSTTQNGLNVLAFDGGDFLTLDGSPIFAQGGTVLVVWKDTGDNNAVIGEGRAVSPAGMWFLGNLPTSGNVRAYCENTSSVALWDLTTGLSTASGLRLTYRSTPDVGTRDIDIAESNGGTASDSGNSTTLYPVTVRQTFGALRRTTTTSQITGWIAEIIVYSDRKTGADIAALETYLDTKWGV